VPWFCAACAVACFGAVFAALCLGFVLLSFVFLWSCARGCCSSFGAAVFIPVLASVLVALFVGGLWCLVCELS
jgi:hypothetical protein